MKSMLRTVLLLFPLMLGGCPSVPSVPGSEPATTEPQEQPEAEQGPSLSGTWTRQDTPLVFNVTDDGAKVHGELLEGGEKDFASYRFDLERKGGKLSGKATFALADSPGKSIETTWSDVKLDGSTITVAQEALDIEDDGSVSGRTKVDKTYAFAPVAEPAAAAAPAAPAMDPYQFVQAPGRVELGPDVKVGYMAVQSMNYGQPMVTSYAIVGEDGDHWLVESESPTIGAMAASFPDLKGALLGLTVKKSDGTVTKAVGGKPGEAGKPLQIMAAQAPPPAGQAPEGQDEKVTIALGEFDSKKLVQNGVSTWVGTDGETKGVLLKQDGGTAETQYELAELPSNQTVDVGGRPVEARLTAFTNGMKIWMTEDPVVAGLFGSAGAEGKRQGMFKMEMKAGSMEITAIKTDAAPRLKW